jgi:hypothetical protein
MIIVGWNADRTGGHKLHAVIAVLVAAAGLAMNQYPGVSAPVVIIGFCIAEMSIMCYYPGYWTLPTKLLRPRIAAAGCGLITMANVGGFVGPYAIGFLTDVTGSQIAGVLVLVSSSILAGVSLTACERRKSIARSDFSIVLKRIQPASLQFGWRNVYFMDENSIIAALDAEIERLNQARALLSKSDNTTVGVIQVRASKPRRAAKRVLSPEARKRIADAQRKRWAKVKKSKKSVTAAAPKSRAKKADGQKKASQKKPAKAPTKKAAQVKPKKVALKKAAIAKTDAMTALPVAV